MFGLSSAICRTSHLLVCLDGWFIMERNGMDWFRKKFLGSKSQLGILGLKVLVPKVRSFSSEITICPKSTEQHSLTVSFLVKSCGLSLESAKSISKRLHFKTLEQPNSVVSLLRDHGFTTAYMSTLIKMRPRLLRCKAEKILLPKLQFLRSIGASDSEIPVILCRNPSLCVGSLKGKLIPLYNLLKSVVISDEIVVRTLTRRLHTCNIHKLNADLRKVIDMGIDPLKPAFPIAFQASAQMSHKTWLYKMEVYHRWGLSREEIRSAFIKQPTFMTLSEKRIMTTMDFLVQKMNWQPADVARVPVVICCSLDKRIIPRCSVLRVLQLKGLIKRKIPVSSVIASSEKDFMAKFVSKYQDQVPQLLKVFQGNANLAELGFGFDQKVEAGN